MSQTPILDRLAPLPAPLRPRPGMTVVVVVWTLVLAALAVSVAVGWPPLLRRGVLTTLPNWVDTWGPGRAIGVALVTVLVSSYVMVAVHEGGHVLGGLAVGFRFRSIRVGPLQLDRPLRLSLHKDLGTIFSGVAIVTPVTTDGLVPRAAVMVAAGPAANILTGCLVLLLPFSTGLFGVLFVVQSIANGLSDLLPYRGKLGVSDGRFLWAMFRHPAHAERWLANMTLTAALQEGVLPESLPQGFLAKAVAVRDGSIDTVVGHTYAFSSAFHGHRNTEAGTLLETCLTYCGHAPAALREALMCEAAVYQASRRQRIDLAEHWLADIPGSTRLPWLRAKAEASIFQARGDVPAALGKLAEYERATSSLPHAWQRDHHRHLVRRWMGELTGGAV